MDNQNEAIIVLTQFATYTSFDRYDDAVAVLQERGLDQPACLLPALAVDDFEVRILALEILANLDPADETLPALIYSLDDPQRLVRLAVLSPLTRFGMKAAKAIPILKQWLDCNDRLTRLLAAQAICQIESSQISNMLPVLIEGLTDGHTLDKSQADYAIGHLGEAGAPAIEALLSLMWDECASVQLQAASAISKITSDPNVEISVGVDLLRADEWLDRYVGAEHLGCMGTAARPALPNLCRTMKEDEDEAVRERARTAIQSILTMDEPSC